MKIAKRSGFGDDGQGDYVCKYDWEENCSCQCGGSGIVFSDQGNYKTAFFEAFPKDIDDYIRGEGSSIEEAEEDAWNKYRAIMDCEGHEYERKGYTNGNGVCKKCGVFAEKVFEPTTTCIICHNPTSWTSDKNKNYYCEDHASLIPEDAKKDWQKEGYKPSPDELFKLMFGQ